jgi:hypothetical protein
MPRKKKSGYEQIFFGEWMDVETADNNGVHLACCDCGLTHHLQHRLHEGRIQFRLSPAVAETRKLRRYYKHEFKKA